MTQQAAKTPISTAMWFVQPESDNTFTVVGRFVKLLSDEEPSFEFYKFTTREWAEFCADRMRALSPTTSTKMSHDIGNLLAVGSDGSTFVDHTLERVTLGLTFRNTSQNIADCLKKITKQLLWGERAR